MKINTNDKMLVSLFQVLYRELNLERGEKLEIEFDGKELNVMTENEKYWPIEIGGLIAMLSFGYIMIIIPLMLIMSFFFSHLLAIIFLSYLILQSISVAFLIYGRKTKHTHKIKGFQKIKDLNESLIKVRENEKA